MLHRILHIQSNKLDMNKNWLWGSHLLQITLSYHKQMSSGISYITDRYTTKL